MLNYPSSGDIIRVNGIRQRRDCRAYRVFNHYIDKLISELMDGGLEEQEAMDRVFLCRAPDDVRAGNEVYACTTCKAKCEYKVNGVSKYEQCKYKDYDLFDGHSARGYTSIGIGEEQRPELAALTMPERLSLAVLKVRPPHSSPDRRTSWRRLHQLRPRHTPHHCLVALGGPRYPRRDRWTAARPPSPWRPAARPRAAGLCSPAAVEREGARAVLGASAPFFPGFFLRGFLRKILSRLCRTMAVTLAPADRRHGGETPLAPPRRRSQTSAMQLPATPGRSCRYSSPHTPASTPL